jgi:CO/xanthine dehydrogenase Mo-binding subunit
MASTVGTSVPVIDAVERVTGEVSYVLNMEVPGMSTGYLVRSPWPRARILNIDTSAAQHLPGVHAVLTGQDLVAQNTFDYRYGRILVDQTILAVDQVRFTGEPVVAIAAIDAEVAEEAAGLIEVEYEALPAVFDPQEALASGPVLHDPRPPLQPVFQDLVGVMPGVDNVCHHFTLRHGDVEKAFSESHHVFEDTFSSPAVAHVALEPHVTIAKYERNRLTIWSSTQMPHSIRAQMSQMFGMPLSRVRVITPSVGGGFGSKGSLRLEPIASALAWKARRPVKIVLRRDEEFVTVTKHPAVIHMKSGLTSDGTLLARQVRAYFNTGAYADVGPIVVRNSGSAMAGPYRIPHVMIDSYAVWTNTVPAGAFRGLGVSQGAWAYESHMDMIATRLGMDPLELRRRNVLRDGDEYATGEVMRDMHYDDLLDSVSKSIGWTSREANEPQPKKSAIHAEVGGTTKSGKGITAVIKATITPSTSTAEAKLHEDGSLSVQTSSVDLGQGSRTVLAQLAAEALDVPYDRVSVSDADTDTTPYDQQTSSSRTTFSMGNALVNAANDVKRQLMDAAAELLEVSVDDLELSDGRVGVRGVPSQSMAYGDVIARSRQGNIMGHGTFVTEGSLDLETGQGRGSVHWHSGAVACEVQVDTETGRVEVTKFSAAVYAGRVVNPRLCEMQIEGSTFFGLGQALFEEIAYDNGQVSNPNLSDYMIPSINDIPAEIHIEALENHDAREIHGVGETSLPPIMPAIANAIFQAVGVRITTLPVTPERVLRELEAMRLAKSDDAQLETRTAQREKHKDRTTAVDRSGAEGMSA